MNATTTGRNFTLQSWNSGNADIFVDTGIVQTAVEEFLSVNRALR